MNSLEWILDASSGLYWNSQHQVWAKQDSTGNWSYADSQGKPVDASSVQYQPQDRRNEDSSSRRHAISDRQGDHSCRARYPRNSERESYKDSLVHDIDDIDGTAILGFPEYGEEGDVSNSASAADERGRRGHRKFHSSRPQLRLIARPDSRSKSLTPPRSLAILEPDSEMPVSVGRDKTFAKRIRLKEIEISKTHATFFWKRSPGRRAGREQERDGWYIVDNASMYGTFILTARAAKHGEKPERLSEPKKASPPRMLNHLDIVLFGSQTSPFASFDVHIHYGFPNSCDLCALRADESNRIPLTDDDSRADTPTSESLAPVMSGAIHTAAPTRAVSRVVEGTPLEDLEKYNWSSSETKKERERKRKQELANLKTQVFGEEPGDGGWAKRKKKKPKCDNPPEGIIVPIAIPCKNVKADVAQSMTSNPVPETDPDASIEATTLQASPYVDRARLRRQAHGPSRDSPPPPPSQRTNQIQRPPSPRALASKPPDPFGSNSKGAALLAKLSGANPLAPNSAPQMGTVVEARSMGTGLGERAGLGSRDLTVGVEQMANKGNNWRDDVREASRKRFLQM